MVLMRGSGGENAVSTEDDADGDAIPKFMDWLKDQPEDVWFDCAGRFASHDHGLWILLAMVDHPRCTKQVAASIFWRMGAYDAASDLLKGGKLNPNSEGDMIIDRILRKWRSGFYQVGEIEFAAPGDLYRRDILKEGSADPLNIPADLLGDFEGRKAVGDSKNPPFGNPRFWDSYASLGLDYASRPGASTDDQPKAGIPGRDAAGKSLSAKPLRPANAHRARHKLGFFGIIGWMIIGGAVIVGLALIAHRLRTGQW